MTDAFEPGPYYAPSGYPLEAPASPYYGAAGYPTATYSSSPPPSFPAPAGYQPVMAPDAVISPQTGWTIAAIVLFWPLGIAAYLASNKVVPALMMGDYATAQRESTSAKRYGIIALIVVIALSALCIAGFIALIAVAASSCANATSC